MSTAKSDSPDPRDVPAPGAATPARWRDRPFTSSTSCRATSWRRWPGISAWKSRRYDSPQELVAAIHERRQLIASLDRDAMLDVIRWGRRPIPINASKDQLGQEIVRIKSLSFGGLSDRGLVALARLRGVGVAPGDDVPGLIRKLKKQEGFFARLNRKKRSWLGSIVSGLMGEDKSETDYQFLPPQQGNAAGTGAAAPESPQPTIREEIEEAGLFGGIAGRIKKSADSYINQKLDEIESRIRS